MPIRDGTDRRRLDAGGTERRGPTPPNLSTSKVSALVDSEGVITAATSIHWSERQLPTRFCNTASALVGSRPSPLPWTGSRIDGVPDGVGRRRAYLAPSPGSEEGSNRSSSTTTSPSCSPEGRERSGSRLRLSNWAVADSVRVAAFAVMIGRFRSIQTLPRDGPGSRVPPQGFRVAPDPQRRAGHGTTRR